ncbi:hypothetical protein DCAR_0415042 [Daucus carota subsp. sativus]|uniref:RRM domain-containing protein n=1 Tax=Daucus carota subsp. sativus TaxID=79200 RepID=A0AAF1AX87_DAUCS|nr:hypothetical protein DCAR_0415042 [Daucus carota subsp. sativus]
MMDESDELTFRVNFNGDRLSNLQHLIKDKLKDFMGDYTDDTLVEYVIVLLKNGRRKVEAKKELNVFLGDDSDCFVSLWDHLEKHLDLYVRPSNACEGATTKPTFREQPTKIDTHHMDAEQERQKPNKLSRSRLGGHMVTSNTLVDEDAHIKDDHLKVSLQSRPILQRKRHRPDERNPMKKLGFLICKLIVVDWLCVKGEGHKNVGRRPESRVGDGDSRRQKGREIGGGGELGAGRRLRRIFALLCAGVSSSGHLEDANSRTIYYSLLQHFNKFGDVLKVIIVTDATTGQPKGSAYVEFTKSKEAEHALSLLDGTSFLSRILKLQFVTSRPQIFRGSIFAASRFGRVPFPRRIPSLYQARPPVKARARSFQWKRGAKMATVESSYSANKNSIPLYPSKFQICPSRSQPNGNSSIV